MTYKWSKAALIIMMTIVCFFSMNGCDTDLQENDYVDGNDGDEVDGNDGGEVDGNDGGDLETDSPFVTSFGSDGIIELEGDYLKDITLDSTGDFYICGKIVEDGLRTNDVAVWKFNADGSPDPAFGTNGVTAIPVVPEKDYRSVPLGITLHTSGNILVTGAVSIPEEDKGLYFDTTDMGYLSGNDMFILKIDADGSVDTGFGGDGYVLESNYLGVWDQDDYGHDITTDSSGNIYVSGRCAGEPPEWSTSNYGMTCWKYTEGGIPYTGFGDDGIFFYGGTAGLQYDDRGFDMLIDSSGDLFIGGYADSIQNSINNDFVIWKVDSTGQLDTGFAGEGFIVYDNTTLGFEEDDQCTALSMDSSGNIYASGFAYSGSTTKTDMIVVKYNSSGNSVTSFGTNGEFRHNGAAGNNSTDKAYSMAIDSQDNLIIVGSSVNESWDTDLAVWKISKDGILDPDFGSSGVLTITDPGGTNEGYGYTGISITSEDEILICYGNEICKLRN